MSSGPFKTCHSVADFPEQVQNTSVNIATSLTTCYSKLKLHICGDCSPQTLPGTHHITYHSVADVLQKVTRASHFRAARLPGQISASGRDSLEEPVPLHLLMQIAHFRASCLSPQISASGRASPAEASPLLTHAITVRTFPGQAPLQISASGQPSAEEPLPLPILMQIAQSGPGCSLLRFCHLAGLPHRSLFP